MRGRFAISSCNRLRWCTEQAAVKIQSKIRQFQAKNRVVQMRKEKYAAVTIQAGYRGFKARQQVELMKYIQCSVIVVVLAVMVIVVS